MLLHVPAWWTAKVEAVDIFSFFSTLSPYISALTLLKKKNNNSIELFILIGLKEPESRAVTCAGGPRCPGTAVAATCIVLQEPWQEAALQPQQTFRPLAASSVDFFSGTHALGLCPKPPLRQASGYWSAKELFFFSSLSNLLHRTMRILPASVTARRLFWLSWSNMAAHLLKSKTKRKQALWFKTERVNWMVLSGWQQGEAQSPLHWVISMLVLAINNLFNQ